MIPVWSLWNLLHAQDKSKALPLTRSQQLFCTFHCSQCNTGFLCRKNKKYYTHIIMHICNLVTPERGSTCQATEESVQIWKRMLARRPRAAAFSKRLKNSPTGSTKQLAYTVRMWAIHNTYESGFSKHHISQGLAGSNFIFCRMRLLPWYNWVIESN